MKSQRFTKNSLVFLITFCLWISKVSPSNSQNQPECLKLPAVTTISLPPELVVTGLSIISDCEAEKTKVLIIETFNIEKNEEEILIRFKVNDNPQKENLTWLETKLLRIKKASSAKAAILPNKKGWVVIYGKRTSTENFIPTIALLKINHEDKDVKFEFIKFQEVENFFSPHIFAEANKIIAIWGEKNGQDAAITITNIVPEEKKEPVTLKLKTQHILDSFTSMYDSGSIFLSWVEQNIAGNNCPELFVEKIDPVQENLPETTSAGEICNEVSLTGIRKTETEFLVDGIIAKGGSWKTFTASLNQKDKKFKLSVRKNSIASYSSDIAGTYQMFLIKERHEVSPVKLSFLNNIYPVSTEFASGPVALSICPEIITGAWIEGEGSSGECKIVLFELELKDSNGNGIFDGIDTCY